MATSPAPSELSNAELWKRIVEVYNRAQSTGACSKTDTKVELLPDPSTGIEFVVRVATALKSKPKGPPKEAEGSGAAAPKAWRNPFLPYEEELWVSHLSDSHTLLLNKFNVVEHHVLVVTRAFQSQQDPLNARDLGAAWKVLQALPQGGLAFYNCGEHSGRSQPHKHLQIVPLPFTPSQPAEAPVQGVVQVAASTSGAAPYTPFAVQGLPYRCYAALLDPTATPEQLESTFQQLLACCQPAAAGPSGAGHHGPSEHQTSSSSVSYNVILTSRFMMLVPRRKEMEGPCAVNSLGFAGTVLVRSEEELGFVRETGPLQLLAAVGQPW